MSQKKVEFDFQPTAPASKVLGMFVGGITSPPGAIESRFSPLYLAWFEWRDIPSSPLSMDMDGTLRTLASANIIANPNCSTLGTLLPLIFMFVFGLAFDILDSLLWLRTPEKISEGAVGGRVTAPLRGRSVFNFCVTAWDFLKARESCSCDSTWSCRKFSRSLSTVSGYSVDSIARRQDGVRYSGTQVLTKSAMLCIECDHYGYHGSLGYITNCCDSQGHMLLPPITGPRSSRMPNAVSLAVLLCTWLFCQKKSSG